MSHDLVRYNKTLVAGRRSKKNIRSFKTLGISHERHHATEERRQERYKKVGNRMRERFRRSRGLRLDGRKRRRRGR